MYRFEYTFPCERWLAEDEDDGRTERVLSLDGVVDEDLSTQENDNKDECWSCV